MMKIPSFIELYRTLIAIPSISSIDATLDQSNETLITALANWFHDLNFQVDIQQVPYTRNKFNMLASAGTGLNGLLLAGHSDTVPFNDLNWTKDPFVLTEHNNKLYGLGSVDMKGFFAFILDSLRNINISKLKKPLHVLVTADEETSMAGAKYFTHNNELKLDCAIIGEPTSLIPIRAHKGYISQAITVIGQSGHSSDPSSGINAIEIMYKVISNLLTLRKKMQTCYNNPIFIIPYPTMNFGYINGGNAVNCICNSCELHIDIRSLPGINNIELEHFVEKALSPIDNQWPGRIKISTIYPPIPSYECPKNTPLIKFIEKLLNKQTESVNYCTEASFIQSICPTIVLGPGSIKQAHQPDEFIDTSFIAPTKKLIAKIIQYFCFTK